MKEKTPKNPIFVVATMMFLSIFIILPPLFRMYIPKEENFVEKEITKHTLYCERVAAIEGKKIISRISYENDVAVKTVMTFMTYTPSDEEIAMDVEASGQTVEQEVNYLKSLIGVNVQENSIQTVIELNQQTAIDNQMDTGVLNYLGKTEDATSYFEGIGFVCSQIND